MPLIDNILINFRYADEVETFLNMLQERTSRRETSESVFDELYGILPPTKVIWTNNSHYNNQWGLKGIVTLSNEWNQLEMNLWYSGCHWYCVRISIFGTTLTAELESPLNQDAYKEIYKLSNGVLEFLRTGFGCLLLKNAAIRKYIYELQANAISPDKKHLLSEILITLLNLKLHDDEQLNQDLFIKRAERIIYHILSERSRYRTSPDCRELAAVSAVRGGYTLVEELYIPINLIWGFLANEPFMRENKTDASPYYYLENYFPDKKADISPLYPALEQDKTEMIFHRNYDSYKQVFPDYETALAWHRIVREILRATGGTV